MAQIELRLTGMTCASCANRVERTLNDLDGVRASVNLATERASVEADEVDAATLIAAVESIGYGASLPTPEPAPEADDRGLRRRLIVSAVLAVPVVLLTMVLDVPGGEWTAFALATPVVLWGGWPFHRATALNLRHRAATMDTLISMGSLAAYGWSLYALLAGGHVYVEVAATVIVFLLLGRFLEQRAKRQAGAALRALSTLGAKDVAVVRDLVEQRIPIEQLVVGDAFVVRPGERIATDGVVLSGASALDAALVTGESMPVEVGAGAEVVGGCVNLSGRLVVRATRVGADTQLAQMARLVEDAQAGKAAAQRLADRISGVFVPTVIVIAAVTLATWLLIGTVDEAFTAAVAVLIIACPCALGLATPTALMVGTGRAAQLGILIKGPEVLEQTRAVQVVVLDKTGTITTGQMALVEVIGDPETHRIAAAVEAASEHPVGRAIAVDAGPLPEVEDFANLAGLGVRGRVEGRDVLVGRPSLLSDEGWSIEDSLLAAVQSAQAHGRTAVLAGWDGAARGVLVVADQIKPTSAQAIAGLRGLGLRPVLLTGDHQATADAVAAAVGIDEVIAGVLPQEKAAVVQRLQQTSSVAMVGDGINDAAALATADLGIAIGTGADVAIEASDLTLVRGDLRVAVDAIRLARRTLGIIRGNLAWAFGYNIAAIPLAAAGLLNPMIAGAAMAFSSVFVVLNSLRLRGFTSSVPVQQTR